MVTMRWAGLRILNRMSRTESRRKEGSLVFTFLNDRTERRLKVDMESRGLLIITLPLIFYANLLFQSQLCSAQLKNKKTRVVFDVVSANNCSKDESGLVNYPRNVKITKLGRDKVVVNMEQIYTQVPSNTRALIEIFKCVDRDASQCEYFMKVPMTTCEFFEAKNQFWTPMFDSVHPPLDCRRIKPGVYKVINATIDTAKLVEMMNTIPNLEAFSFFWKFRVAVMSKNKRVICADYVTKVDTVKT